VREWPLEHWAELVGKLKELPGVEVLQIVADRNVTVKDASSPIVTGARPVECADHVARLIETIAAADLLIAVESGPVHVAQAVGTNCVALFGPTDPALRVWREDAVAAVHHQIHCSFCHHRRPRLHWESGCPFGIACMQGIQVEQVFNAARSFLGWPADERVTS
jgi:ADP-heptose:LPS heptosyltransferase